MVFPQGGRSPYPILLRGTALVEVPDARCQKVHNQQKQVEPEAQPQPLDQDNPSQGRGVSYSPQGQGA